ncbi:hypothetical protein [Streptomyces sp. NPDC059639]|uniref:hypothetical protein n=1 Tax=Streptomyces sp. NPDC059639 TaxID=3346891 RepID=UPI003696DD04
MRSRRAARSTRLVLAAVAVTALAATATACGPDDTKSAGASSPASADSGRTGTLSEKSPSGESGSGSTASKDKTGSGTGTGAGTGDGKSGYGQSCGTNDLTFTLTEETQAGGYYQVAARAKSGISCYLDVNTPSAAFGSGTEGVASPVGQGGEDPIKLSGSAVAYTGISPKSTNTNGGVQFENVIVSLTDADPNPAELKLPRTATVDKPIVTNWSTDPAETVPVLV